MTDLPRSFCPECEKPLSTTGERVSIYGLTGEHWDCAQKRMARRRDVKPFIFDPKWKPEPDKLEGRATGWLSPDGTFYGCPRSVHVALGEALGEYFGIGSSANLELAGWGHISSIGFHLRTDDRAREPTQAQLDALWDWYMSIKDRLGVLDDRDGPAEALSDDDRVLKWSLEGLFRRQK